jgi:DNA modification methylase
MFVEIAMSYLNQILHGDCLSALKEIPDNTIDLIFTSPPYADQRKSTYGGIHADEYVDWFLPRSAEYSSIILHSALINSGIPNLITINLCIV